MTLGEEKQRALHSRRVTPRDQWKTKPIRSFRPYRVSLFLDAQLFWYGKHTRGSAMKPSPGCGMYSFFVVPPLPCSIFWNDLMHLSCSKRFPFHQFFMPCPVAVPIPNPLWAGFMHKETIQMTLPLRVFLTTDWARMNEFNKQHCHKTPPVKQFVNSLHNMGDLWVEVRTGEKRRQRILEVTSSQNSALLGGTTPKWPCNRLAQCSKIVIYLHISQLY